MTLGTLDKDQQAAARTAGFLYLFLGVLPAFGLVYISSGILVPRAIAQTAHAMLGGAGRKCQPAVASQLRPIPRIRRFLAAVHR